MPDDEQRLYTIGEDCTHKTNRAPGRKKSPVRPAARSAEEETPTAWPLSPATEAMARQVAGALQVRPDLVVEVAVAEWCRQQAEALHLTLHSPGR